MSASDSDRTTTDARINQIIADYLQAIEDGEVPDRAGLLVRHADCADELSAFFADHDHFQRAAVPLADALTLPPCQLPAPGRGPRVAYFGDYELLEEIARGGMGVVYKARQISLNRPVALKMILAGEFATPEARQRFRTEAEAAANLQHPNIVAIHEVGEHQGRQYFSMDFVAGRNLADLARGNPLSAERAASYVQTIAEAIHFAHQRGTLHRDLKPQNVLIDGDDRPRITDFGLAKRVETDSGLTRTGDVLGSPSYMPPEQAGSNLDEVGPHSDVYSLGAILYELLTGRPPFRGATAAETLCQVIQVPPSPLRKLNPDIPQDLETICLKCLEKQPARRYHSARELAEELGRFLIRQPIHARPASAARRGVFWARRHPWIITTIASLVMAALAFLAYGLWAQNRFLVWQQSHLDYVRAAGMRTERLETLRIVSSILFACLLFGRLFYLRSAQRTGSEKQLNDPFSQLLRLRHVPSAKWILSLGLLGGVGVLYSFTLVGLMTEAYVWEGTRNFQDLLYVYALLFFGIMAILTSVQDSTRREYGSSLRSPLPVDVELIRRLVQDGDVIEAIKEYRRQAGDVSKAAARDYVAHLAEELEAKQPGEIAAKARRLYRVSWKRLAIGLMFEGVVLGGILFVVSEAARTPWALEFLGGWLIGTTVMFATRSTGGFGRRFAIMLAPVIGWVLLNSTIKEWYPEYHMNLGAFTVGLVAGIALLITAIAKVPKRQPTPASEEERSAED